MLEFHYVPTFLCLTALCQLMTFLHHIDFYVYALILFLLSIGAEITGSQWISCSLKYKSSNNIENTCIIL